MVKLTKSRILEENFPKFVDATYKEHKDDPMFYTEEHFWAWYAKGRANEKEGVGVSVYELKYPRRTLNALASAGFTTVDGLVEYFEKHDYHDLWEDTRGIGVQMAKEIETYIKG